MEFRSETEKSADSNVVGFTDSRYLVVCRLSTNCEQWIYTNRYRASLSHGTPKHINRAEWDVPLPDFDSLSISAIANRSEVTDDRLEGARSFIALCRLTEILGEVLPLIYALHVRKEISCLKALRRVEASLDEWEDSLPEWLDLNRSEFQRNASGALNLQLSFLAVKMCICRIALQVR